MVTVRESNGGTLIAVFGCSTLFFLVLLMVWGNLVYTNGTWMNGIASFVDAQDLDALRFWPRLLVLTPPLAVTLVVAFFLWRRWAHDRVS